MWGRRGKRLIFDFSPNENGARGYSQSDLMDEAVFNHGRLMESLQLSMT
jgi:hypothetical protein